LVNSKSKIRNPKSNIVNIKISTKVNQSLLKVWEGFNLELFSKLAPPFPPVVVKEFGGCLKGDKVHLELNFILFKQDWISDIVDQKRTESEIYFIDEGIKLPFFLKYWQHRHRLVKDNQGTLIIDDITFKTPTILTDFLFYPLMYLQFLYRKPIYKKVFE
jgi:ligand-binding SRPBCC domain-containing protein